MEVHNLDKLADQIYQEGIDKAEKESKRILEEAQQRADQIVATAKEDAERIEKEAEKAASRQVESARNEISLASKQVLSELKSSINDLLLDTAVRDKVQKSLEDVEFIKQLIREALGKWSPDSDLEVTVPERQADEILEFVKNQSAKSLSSATIVPSQKMSRGFIIEEREKGYYISFTEADFESYLSEYISPAIQKLIFK